MAVSTASNDSAAHGRDRRPSLRLASSADAHAFAPRHAIVAPDGRLPGGRRACRLVSVRSLLNGVHDRSEVAQPSLTTAELPTELQRLLRPSWSKAFSQFARQQRQFVFSPLTPTQRARKLAAVERWAREVERENEAWLAEQHPDVQAHVREIEDHICRREIQAHVRERAVRWRNRGRPMRAPTPRLGHRRAPARSRRTVAARRRVRAPTRSEPEPEPPLGGSGPLGAPA